ncbi:MAG: carbohydrate binding domain-containing protein [Agathobacter sp.]|nr:carbohydrate binding domain-containing protein [Agathobacter sp.]
MKKKRILACILSTAMLITTMPLGAAAETDADTTLSYEGYTQVWADEFNGDTLNRDDWNVELHEKGWVNNELQEYVDSDENIQIKDGKLVINPVETIETISTDGAQNLLTNADFSDGFTDWEETIANWDNSADATRSQGDGQIIYDITKAGTADWHVQLKHAPITVEAGKTYKVSFKAASTATRTICSGVMNGTTYEQHGQKFVQLNADEETAVSYTFTPAVTDDNSIYYFSLGKMENEDSIASKITLSDLSISEAPANMLSADAFGADAVDGVISKEVTSANMGSNPWDVQILQDAINVEAGETYDVTFTASATTPRTIVAGVQKTSDDYAQYGQGVFELTTEPTEYTYEVNSNNTDSNAGIYFNLGKSDNAETPDSTITISDVKMVKRAVAGTKVKKSYTSGRISTQNKQTFTYGLFEARVKVPKGQGFLPAFWLMANDENVYGQWPRCGEIDCMEVMGQDTSKAYGTIHFGNPHSESQGTYVTGENEADFSDDFHIFSCEWEPGKIKWYVDGKLFHEESDWYSTTEGQGTLTYPAPFDQPFYIILNLAVGGSWVGNPDENTSFENNPYEIDYVRVYQKDEYNEDVEKPVKEVVIRDPQADGNYINNGNFATAEDLTDEEDWKFMTALGGEATAEIANNQMTIKTTNEGTVDYSVQLVQPNLPLVKGATYEVSFDASASEARTMGVDIKAPDHGYKSYMPHQEAELTTETQNYTYTFVMKDDTDANGRLEYNMGAKGSTADINISKVSVKKIADPDPNAKEDKTVLANGNYIYNGSFQEGANHLGYWNINKTQNATTYVSNYTDGRRFCLASNDGKVARATLSQDELTFASGKPYTLSFSARAAEDTTLTVSLGGKKYNVSVKGGTDETYTIHQTS